MKRKPSLFSRLGQIVLAMALLSGLSVGVSACARNNITALADRTPKLDLSTFFVGQTFSQILKRASGLLGLRFNCLGPPLGLSWRLLGSMDSLLGPI